MGWCSTSLDRRPPASQPNTMAHISLAAAATSTKPLHLRAGFLSSSPSIHNPTLHASSSSESVVSSAVSILIHRRSKSRWSSLLSLCRSAGGGFASEQVSAILLGVRNHPRLAHSFFRFILLHSLCTPSLLSYSTIVHILARSRHRISLAKARCLLREAVIHNNDDGYDGVKLKIFDALVRTYRQCDSAPVVFDLLIQACLDLNRVQESVHMVRLLRSRGMALRIGVCNALIDRVSRRIGCLEAYLLYKELFDIGDRDVKDGGSTGVVTMLKPNACTFNGLMLSFYRNGMFDRVEEIWTEMGELACCEPNLYSYNILMAAYCDGGEIGKAWDLWMRITSKGLRPDVVAYNTLIGGYCELGMVEKGEELYREMIMSGIEPTCLTYQHLMLGYCGIEDLDSAMLLYKDMRSKGFTPSSSTIDVVMAGLCYVERVFEALNLFNAVVSENNDFVAKRTSYDLLIKGLCVEGELKEALKLQAQMAGKGFLPDSEIYCAFIECCEKHGKPDMAEILRKEMVQTLARKNDE